MGKQRIPRDVTQAALYLVRGQPAREKRYREQKNKIAGYDKKTPGGNPAWVLPSCEEKKRYRKGAKEIPITYQRLK